VTAYHGGQGEEYAQHVTDNLYNAYTDRPAMLGLAGDVTGLRVLDLGCGAGHYAAEFLDRGAAEVVGVEASESLLRHARDRVGDRATLYQHDLEEPLEFLADGAFDLAVMALVYHHVTRRAELLAEVRRVLRPGGALLVSTTHPVAEWNPDDRPYFSNELVTVRPKSSRHSITFWHLTLERFIGELLDAGFTLTKLVEPRAVEEAKSIDPIRHAKTQRTPIFLAVRLVRGE